MAVATLVKVDRPSDPSSQCLVVSNTVSDHVKAICSTLLLTAPPILVETIFENINVANEGEVDAKEMTGVPDETVPLGLDDIVKDDEMDDAFLSSDTRNDEEQFQNSEEQS